MLEIAHGWYFKWRMIKITSNDFECIQVLKFQGHRHGCWSQLAASFCRHWIIETVWLVFVTRTEGTLEATAWSDAPWTFTQKLQPWTIFIETVPCCMVINCSITDTKETHGKGYTFHWYISSCFQLHLSLNLMLSSEKCWCLSTTTELIGVNLDTTLEKSETKIDFFFMPSHLWQGEQRSSIDIYTFRHLWVLTTSEYNWMHSVSVCVSAAHVCVFTAMSA